MNIIKTLLARVEEYRATNKQPCKSYATQEAAEKATGKMAQEAATYFDKQGRADAPPANYIVVYNAAWGRWVGFINMSELIARPTSGGGYVGFCTGFFTW